MSAISGTMRLKITLIAASVVVGTLARSPGSAIYDFAGYSVITSDGLPYLLSASVSSADVPNYVTLPD